MKENIKDTIKAIIFIFKIFTIPFVILFALFCVCGAIGMYYKEHRPITEIVNPNLHGTLFTENNNWINEDELVNK